MVLWAEGTQSPDGWKIGKRARKYINSLFKFIEEERGRGGKDVGVALKGHHEKRISLVISYNCM